jgi:hypothetical protein
MEALVLEYCLGIVTAVIGVSVIAGMAVIVGVGVDVDAPPCFPVHPEKRTTSPMIAIRIIDLNCAILTQRVSITYCKIKPSIFNRMG